MFRLRRGRASPLRLDRLLAGVPVLRTRGDPSATEVVDVCFDSTEAGPGSLFCCLRGTRRDGHDFAPAAVERGAVALLAERLLPLGVTQVVVDDARAAMAPVAATLHGNPSRELTVVGVTGTNGKTTTTMLLQAIFEAAGRPTGVIGTTTGARTTPEAPVLQASLAAFLAEGRLAAAVEVSSVGLVQRRVDAVHFAAAIFTNLAPEHLDDHGTMEAYFQAKATLFRPERAALGVVNADDEHGRRLLQDAAIPMHPFSIQDVDDLELGVGWSRFGWDGVDVVLPLDGAHNVENALAAATCARALGLEPDAVARGLAALPVLAGRAEPVEAGQDFRVVVDYAHTPRALERTLASARRASGDAGRVIVVFGCGGDRDPSKRAPMGRVACQGADLVVVTSDNPRSEDPLAIIEQVCQGAGGGAPVVVEPDRRAAIALALERAGRGDVVVIAGKGHETVQITGDQVVPFDDRVVARELLGQRAPA
ncbi:MAG: UDP-N-acetylmuramoyl-L-alanyl-D-glutamate--2,6-diaminopimelate ligase [Actinobacteria bacterium]|nr:UDP-N-acetylmuramoyl-L-alanyl-D-glutamate--2,6-diaminopimelate ligase [Actinomycetota bacterium]